MKEVVNVLLELWGLLFGIVKCVFYIKVYCIVSLGWATITEGPYLGSFTVNESNHTYNHTVQTGT